MNAFIFYAKKHGADVEMCSQGASLQHNVRILQRWVRTTYQKVPS